MHATSPRHIAVRLIACLAALLAGVAERAVGCPFCAAEQRTLTEEITDSSVILLGKLLLPEGENDPTQALNPETGEARFSVERVYKGDDLMGDAQSIEAIYFGAPNLQSMYFIRGVGSPPDWAIPLELSETAVAYVDKLFELPPAGADRLAFFQDFLEHEEPLLAQDAYDEFARAPYQAVIDLKDRMDREQLLAWIESPSVSPSRRRLFLTMLGVCGTVDDAARIETMLTSDNRVLGPAADAVAAASLGVGGPLSVTVLPDLVRFRERQQKLGLDAMIACYLTLKARQGEVTNALDLVDERFLSDPSVDYSHIYSTLMALRFLAEEQRETVPLDRVLTSARLLLDNQEFADQVIPDLARWEDWTVLERLANMFSKSVLKNKNKYVREPIITYLDVAAEVEGEVGDRAIEALVRIEPLDPEAVKRARSLRAFGFLAQARSRPAVSATGTLTPDGTYATKAESAPASEPPADATNTQTESAPEAKETPPSEAIAVAPPSRAVLIGAPVAAAALCVGLFWLILRGGSA